MTAKRKSKAQHQAWRASPDVAARLLEGGQPMIHCSTCQGLGCSPDKTACTDCMGQGWMPGPGGDTDGGNAS